MEHIRKTFTGKVLSDKMDKTCVVEVTRKVKHPIYKKYILKRKKYKVHDEKNEAKVGNNVVISETRPISKEKRFRIIDILNK